MIYSNIFVSLNIEQENCQKLPGFTLIKVENHLPSSWERETNPLLARWLDTMDMHKKALLTKDISVQILTLILFWKRKD
ncbi:hypothetical protein DXT88_04040 [Herbaspirillum lusitanum]|nr:hypothetical protein [Herbaspirillum lusitanum]